MRAVRVVAGHTGHQDTDGLDGFAHQRVLDVDVPVEAVVEGLADVDVAEEVGRDAVAVQLAAADEGVAAIGVGDVEVEEDVGAGD